MFRVKISARLFERILRHNFSNPHLKANKPFRCPCLQQANLGNPFNQSVRAFAVHSRQPLVALCTSEHLGHQLTTRNLARLASEPKTIKQFIMPDIGEGINEVVIKEWHVKVGDRVKEFDDLCEVASDKASATLPSPYEGVIKVIHYETESMAKVGTPLVDIEAVSSGEPQLSPPPKAQQPELVVERTSSLKVAETPIVAALPSVRRLASEKGVDLRQVKASGKFGQVLKEDLLSYLDTGSAQVDTVYQVDALRSSKVVAREQKVGNLETVVPLSDIGKAMHKTMTKSLEIPHFGYADEIDMTRLVEWQAEEQKRAKAEKSTRISTFAFIIKMVSLALRDFPQLNASIDERGECLVHKHYHNIGVAVDTKAGLVVPSVKNVQTLSVSEINSELLRLRELGYNSKLSPHDLGGATISLSNIGAIGGIFGIPVIVSPAIMIGALGRTRRLPRYNSLGQLEARHILTLVWSADHRVVDGATVSRFSNLLKSYLEEPVNSLLKVI